jgi:hypothetical protein
LFKVGKAEDYRKMSESRLSSFISVLEVDPNVIIYPRKTICGVIIEHSCNQIVRNEAGAYEEVEGTKHTRGASEEDLDEEVSKEMDTLIASLRITSGSAGSGSSTKPLPPLQPPQPPTAIIPRATINSHIILD